ncbi:MAG: YraN family protein [Gammaproteobacteria bacterium]|nr:YraN family protein [Gammaproteobacteria bacterium]
MSSSERGQQAEERACRFLQDKGLKLLTRNYSCRQGEIDLVMHDNDMLVFVEVRYRSNKHYGSAVESVDSRKQAKLIRAAQHYLQQHRQAARNPCRFDVIGIIANGTEIEIDWLRNAIEMH